MFEASAVSNDVPKTPSISRMKISAWPWWRGGFEFATASRIGLHHDENEDSARNGNRQIRWLIVADGVGGGALGAVASRLLVERFESYATNRRVTPETFTAWLSQTDQVITAEIAERVQGAGAATFAAAVAKSWSGNVWTILWVGDCRAYLYRGGDQFEQLTTDQTYGAMGETPPSHAGTDDPARMVGCGAIAHPGWGQATMRRGDTLFVCSDGVHRFVDADRMVSVLHGTSTLNQVCRKILAEVSAARGYDDATIAAVRRHRWFGASGWYWFWLAVGIASFGALGFA
jgi:protein phosphatase